MKKRVHDFIENYDGFLGFGWDRETDENTVHCYLQMFSDDRLMKTVLGRFTDQELDEIYTLVNRLLQRHLNDFEYHSLFLRDEDDSHDEPPPD